MGSNYERSGPKLNFPRGKQSPSRGKRGKEPDKRDGVRTAPEQTVFKKAWNLLQNVCDSASQPLTLVRPNLSHLDGEKIEFIRSTLSGNGNFGDGSSESNCAVGRRESSECKGLAERKSSSGGMNCILEIPEFLPSRRSRSRSGSREYQELLDGTKSVYPFRNSKSPGPEPGRFLDFNYPRPGGYAQGSRTPEGREIGVEQQGLLVSRDYLDGINTQLDRIKVGRQSGAQEDLRINVTLAVTPALTPTHSNHSQERAEDNGSHISRDRVESSMQTDLQHFTLQEDEEVWRVGREQLRPALDPESMSTFPSRVPSGTERRPKSKSTQSSSWLGLLDIPNLMGYTAASFKSVLNLADHVVSHYMIPPGDNLAFTEEEMNADEDLVAISLMRLIGIPQQLRHHIYQEALNEVTAIKDISSGSLDVLNCLIDWLSSGNTGGREELLKKARILATIHSEVEPDSEVWRQFERDVSIFSLAVRDVVKDATTTCSQTVANQITESGVLEHMTNSLTSIDVDAQSPPPTPLPQNEVPEPTPSTSSPRDPPVDNVEGEGTQETDTHSPPTCPVLSTETFDVDGEPRGYPEFNEEPKKTEEVKEVTALLGGVYERVLIEDFVAQEMKRFAEITQATLHSIPTDPLSEEFNPNQEEPPIVGRMGRDRDAFLEAQDPSFYEFGIASAFANVVNTISSTLHLSRLSTLFPSPAPAPPGNEQSPLTIGVEARSELDENGNPVPETQAQTPPPHKSEGKDTGPDVNGNHAASPQSRVYLSQDSVDIRFGSLPTAQELIGGITEEEEPDGLRTPDKPIDGGSSVSIVEEPRAESHRGEMAQILQRLQPLWSEDTVAKEVVGGGRVESPEKPSIPPQVHCVEKRGRGRSRIPRPTFSSSKSFQYLDPSKASTIAIYVPDRPPHAQSSSLAMCSQPIPRPTTTPQRAQFYYSGGGSSGSKTALSGVVSKNSYSQLLAQKKEYSTKVSPGIPFSGKKGGSYRINRHASPSLAPNKPFLVLQETTRPRGPKGRQPRDQSSIPSYRSHHGSQRQI